LVIVATANCVGILIVMSVKEFMGQCLEETPCPWTYGVGPKVNPCCGIVTFANVKGVRYRPRSVELFAILIKLPL